MRIIQTVNDTIRLLFNPKTEVFCLSDFLLVRDCDENFLGQVVEVYDDKFDQEANVAKIRLVYRIVNGKEMVPYDSYTPSRECEVAKIKQSEIEKCINLNKKTIKIGLNPKNNEETAINTDFFENKCVIFADKFEQTNRLFETIAPKLALIKPVVILDFSGTCLPFGASSFVAGENFKMPVSYETIDYIQQKTLLRAKIETQVILSDVFEEIKNFFIDSNETYIPITQLIKVIQGQCKAEHSAELLVLTSWLKKYFHAGIFAKNKKEFETVLKSIKKNKIISIDFSNIKSEWQKEFIDYVTGQIKQDVFVLIRLNDNNINNDIINSIYLKRKNINFIPSFAYGYKKTSYIMDFAQNYILMPTLNPKRDFTYANFQIQSLNKESFMLFGADTKDFIFILKSFDLNQNEKNSKENDKAFISLNLQLEDMTPFELKPDNFTLKQSTPKTKRLQEEIMLSDVLGKEEPKEILSEQDNENKPDDKKNAQDGQKTNLQSENENPEPKLTEPDTLIQENELDYFDVPKEAISAEEIISSEETAIENEIAEIERIQNESLIAVEKNDTIPKKFEQIQKTVSNSNVQNHPETIIQSEVTEIEPQIPANLKIISEENKPQNEITSDEKQVENFEAELTKNIETEIKISPELDVKQEAATQKPVKNQTVKKVTKSQKMPQIKKIPQPKEELETTGELERFVMAQESSEENLENEQEKIQTKKTAKPVTSANSKKTKSKKNEEQILTAGNFDNAIMLSQGIENESVELGEAIEKTKDEVSAIVNKVVNETIIEPIEQKLKDENDNAENKFSEPVQIENSNKDDIDSKFAQIMSLDVNSLNTNKLQIDNNISIDLEKIKKEIKTPEHKLPIFNDDEDETKENSSIGGFKQGEFVIHEKYGKGEIKKVISYGAKSLLQIDFGEVGKRLLDPRIAKLKQVQEI